MRGNSSCYQYSFPRQRQGRALMQTLIYKKNDVLDKSENRSNIQNKDVTLAARSKDLIAAIKLVPYVKTTESQMMLVEDPKPSKFPGAATPQTSVIIVIIVIVKPIIADDLAANALT